MAEAEVVPAMAGVVLAWVGALKLKMRLEVALAMMLEVVPEALG